MSREWTVKLVAEELSDDKKAAYLHIVGSYPIIAEYKVEENNKFYPGEWKSSNEPPQHWSECWIDRLINWVFKK